MALAVGAMDECLERRRVLAAVLHPRDELRLLVGRHGLEALHRARLPIRVVAAASRSTTAATRRHVAGVLAACSARSALTSCAQATLTSSALATLTSSALATLTSPAPPASQCLRRYGLVERRERVQAGPEPQRGIRNAQDVAALRHLDLQVRRHAGLETEILVRNVEHRRVGRDVVDDRRVQADLRDRSVEIDAGDRRRRGT